MAAPFRWRRSPGFGYLALQGPGLDQEAAIKQLSYVLRLEPEEWRSMCYRHVKGRDRFKQRSFYGERLAPTI